MIAVDTGPVRSFFRRESSWDRVRKPLGKAALSSLTAGATIVALSAASAATSAARRRKEGA